MTINLANNNPRIAYSLAQGSTQQTFAIPFEFFNNSDVTVYIDATLKSEGTHYSLTGGDGSTGNVVFNTTVTGATGGSTIVIFRLSDIERTSDFSAGADINRAALNEQLDILTAMIADQDDRIDRAIRSNPYEVAPTLILPTVANRKGKVLAFNETTGAVQSGPTISAVDTVANTAADIQTVADNIAVIQASPTNATNAAASASAASSSASAASSSASSASASASSAAASFDSFDDRYLGAKTSDPTVDNDGNALLTGALYFDSVSAVMKVYNGSTWVAAYVSLSGALIASSNLSDLTNTTSARSNLGLGSIATQAASAVTISGGSINNTPIGATTPSTVAGTTGVFSGNLTVDTNTLFVNASNDRVGIGTSSPTVALDVLGAAKLTGQLTLESTGPAINFDETDTTDENFRVRVSGGSLLIETLDNDLTTLIRQNMSISSTGNTSVDSGTLFIDAVNNRVGIGTNSPAVALDVVGGITATTALSITGADSTASQVILQSFRNGAGTQTGGVVRIRSLGDGTNDSVQMIFDTNSIEAMRIDASQNLLIGTTNADPITANVTGTVCAGNNGMFQANADGTGHRLGRRQDGVILAFYSAGDVEGNISISGTTTSYNGGHLSRWSQTADNTRISGLLKGTVLTNLDQMAVWASQANEQLNCMAVSTVEGDANVAGVFVNWDDDDEVFTSDMNVAMTGDMVIRIAAGTTVQRGDLLMSAGDGTAKPQGDDIVRAKTIAKVTSTYVSETYADGSYVVPCVLMAC
jgi:hypothetical protein